MERKIHRTKIVIDLNFCIEIKLASSKNRVLHFLRFFDIILLAKSLCNFFIKREKCFLHRLKFKKP